MIHKEYEPDDDPYDTSDIRKKLICFLETSLVCPSYWWFLEWELEKYIIDDTDLCASEIIRNRYEFLLDNLSVRKKTLVSVYFYFLNVRLSLHGSSSRECKLISSLDNWFIIFLTLSIDNIAYKRNPDSKLTS